MKNCAMLTMDNLSDFECYDSLLDAPLAQRDWQTQLVPWRRENVDWQQFDAVIIRSPWDYQEDASAFISVLEEIECSSTVLQNSLATVRWNIDKIYLKSLNEQHVNIVPTLWGNNLSGKDVIHFFDHFNCQQIVIKPRISANADNTFWLKKESVETVLEQLERIFSQVDFMVQPFMNSVVEEGEFSLFYFDGEYSHAILKKPKTGDFRVQEEHGGQLHSITPEKSLLMQAKHTLAMITKLTGETPLYARIDFVRDNHSYAEFALMEAELIEPSLYFNMDKNSADAFARAFVKRMGEVS